MSWKKKGTLPCKGKFGSDTKMFFFSYKRRNVIVDTFPILEYEDGQIKELVFPFCRIIPVFFEASEHTYMGNFTFLSGRFAKSKCGTSLCFIFRRWRGKDGGKKADANVCIRANEDVNKEAPALSANWLCASYRWCKDRNPAVLSKQSTREVTLISAQLIAAVFFFLRCCCCCAFAVYGAAKTDLLYPPWAPTVAGRSWKAAAVLWRRAHE